MADEIDLANEQSERWLNQALSNVQSAPRLMPRGHCIYCETPFEKTDPSFARKLFCDSSCSEDYETEQRLRARK